MPFPEWEQKVWGRTRCLHGDGRISVHELEILPGGFCSIHYHLHRHNHFLLLSGELDVVDYAPPEDGLWAADRLTLSRRQPLGTGFYLFVPARAIHRFESRKDGPGAHVIEVYDSGTDGVPVREDDIERLTEGGRL